MMKMTTKMSVAYYSRESDDDVGVCKSHPALILAVVTQVVYSSFMDSFLRKNVYLLDRYPGT